MAPRFVRGVLALAVCPLLGGMLGRHYLASVLRDVGAESWGWVIGVLIGLAYAIGLTALALGSRRALRRLTADLILLALCVLALADMAAQLTQTPFPLAFHLTGVVYVLGLAVVFTSIRSRGGRE